MNLLATRARKAPSAANKPIPISAPIPKREDTIPTLEELIASRDYTGAVTLLEFLNKTGDGNKNTLPWLAYSAFHLGDFKKAYDVYGDLLSGNDTDPSYHLYRAACLFYMEQFQEAVTEARQGPSNKLQNRILMHCAYKLNDDTLLNRCLNNANGTPQDSLSVSALLFNRGEYQSATDEYQRLFKEYVEYDAINIYLAMCCYKLDHFKFALELVDTYLMKHPDSASAMNLKVCYLIDMIM